MQKKRNFLKSAGMMLLLSATIGEGVMAQDVKNNDTTTFHPHGAPVVTVFSNFHVNGSDKTAYGFEMERAYLGYQFDFAKNFSGKMVFDIGKSSDVGDLQRIAYVKNAFLDWHPGKLSLKAGLIGLTQFDAQEKLWGHRYIMKSFMDEYKFGSSADLGLSVTYKFVNWFSADVEIVNGEGYKKLQLDNRLLYAVGLTFHPVKAMTIRAYGDINAPSADSLKPQDNLSLFIGWKQDKFAIGAEGNYLLNKSYVEAHHQMGASVYGSVNVATQFELFARWDLLTSQDKWNEGKDGQCALLGFQYQPVKQIKIAPDARLWVPAATDSKIQWGAYLNLEMKL